MGYAIARQAMLRGAEVTLVSGPTELTPPPFVRVVPVVRAADMFEAVKERWESQDLAWLGQHKKENQVLCGFSMETRDVLENSDEKLKKKNADMIAANCLKEKGAGFGTDTNHLSLISRNGIEDLPMMSKEAAADWLLDALKILLEDKKTGKGGDDQ